LQGHDVVLIASSESAYAYSVVALPSISNVEQLKGKRLGVSGFGSASHNAALIFLRKFELEANKDVLIVVAGATTERLTAMAGGSIDATLLTPTEVVSAKKRSYREIYDLLDMGVEVQGNGLATSRSYIKASRPTVKAALKGYVESIHYIHHNAEGTKAIVAKYLRGADPDVLRAAHQAFVKIVSKKPYPTLKGIQFLLEQVAGQIPQAKKAKPDQFIDVSLLNELAKEGFFVELAKKYP
jgi:NitT/TauT family transport system substrate-binding protein